MMACEPGQGGRHRLRPQLTASGGVLAAAGVMLLAAASTSPVAVPAAAPDVPRKADAETGPVRGHYEQPWMSAGDDAPAAVPDVPAASGPVSDVDNVEPRIPVVFTGDIPATVLDAYKRARDVVNFAQPGCHLPLELLEAIGKVEGNHARGGLVDAHGTALRPILGPVLDGNVFAAIPDTDRGVLDGDVTWDRAVGPMQFIPGTWQRWASDGNGDRRADPQNVYDASLATARYLCAANRDLGTPQGLDDAIFSYNHSVSYRNLVLSWMATYRGGTIVVPDATTGGPVLAATNTPQETTPTTPVATTTTTPPTSTTTTPPTTTTTTPPETPTSTPSTSAPSTPVQPTSEAPAPPSTAPSSPPPVTTEPAPAPSDPVGGLVCTIGGILTPILGPVCPTDAPAGG
jgi:hypothetical protein